MTQLGIWFRNNAMRFFLFGTGSMLLMSSGALAKEYFWWGLLCAALGGLVFAVFDFRVRRDGWIDGAEFVVDRWRAVTEKAIEAQKEATE